MDDAFSCLRSLSLWRSLAAFPAGRALASAKPGPKVDRHIIADLEQHSTWKIRDFPHPSTPRYGGMESNGQRVRLNEAWYYIILLLSGLVPNCTGGFETRPYSAQIFSGNWVQQTRQLLILSASPLGRPA